MDNLFCGISSIGIPFPKENKKHIGFFDIVMENLKYLGYNIDGFNISSLDKNHTWDLEKILKLNYNLSKIRNIQINSIDNLRNQNMLFKLIIPKEIKEKYISEIQTNNSTTLKDMYINSKNPAFIYSAGPNDFFSYIKAGPVELMNKEVRKKLPDNLNEIVIKCINNIEQIYFY